VLSGEEDLVDLSIFIDTLRNGNKVKKDITGLQEQ
jgi:hypothetical protein